MKKANGIIAGVLFVLAGLLMIYTVWAFINCINYISEMTAAGQLVVKGNEYDIVNFYMGNSVQYLISAVLVFAAGWIVWCPFTASQSRNHRERAASGNIKKDEDDLDAWFEEMDAGDGKDN